MDLYRQSKIKGDFNGWDDQMLFALDNGDIWEQARYRYRYKYSYRPNVKIFRDGGKYLLEVDGMDEMIEVRRVR